MAGIKHISDLYKKYGEKELREILNRPVRITEKFDAFRFSFEKSAKTYKLFFYGKNGKTSISKIDRTLSDLYESAINYIESLPYEIRKDLPVRHRFGFSWFPTSKPIHTEYERRPKNGLILTDITIRDRKNDVTREVTESEVYERYAKILNVEYAKPVFEGILDESIVNTLISIGKNHQVPGLLTESFDTKGYLNQIHPNVEALIFESENQLFKVSQNEEHIISEKRSHMFDILLLDILEHLETYNILGTRCVSTSIDEAYIETVSEIFNDYVDKRGKNYLESGMKKPVFLEKTGKFNNKWIKNPKTRAIIEKNSQYEYLLSVFIANLRKPKFASGLLNESVANRFNSKIEEIDKVIGDDYSFLEFNTILKEDKVLTTPSQQDPDYEKGVHLLTKVFNPERKFVTGKTPINVIVLNGGCITNRVVQEAVNLFDKTKTKTVIIHAKDLYKRNFGANKDSVEKIIARLVVDNPDVFEGYYKIPYVSMSNILKKLRPKYEPLMIHSEHNTISLQKEAEGMNAVYSNPVGFMKGIKIGMFKNLDRQKFQDSLTNDSYKDFCKYTPPCMHPYWNEVKSSFDKYTYN
jgi:hypothetical protein